MPDAMATVAPGEVSSGTPSTVRFAGAVGSDPSRGRFDPVWSFNFASTWVSVGFATNAPSARAWMSAALVAS